MRKDIVEKLDVKIKGLDHKFSLETAKLNTILENELGIGDQDDDDDDDEEEEGSRKMGGPKNLIVESLYGASSQINRTDSLFQEPSGDKLDEKSKKHKNQSSLTVQLNQIPGEGEGKQDSQNTPKKQENLPSGRAENQNNP